MTLRPRPAHSAGEGRGEKGKGKEGKAGSDRYPFGLEDVDGVSCKCVTT